MTLAFSSALRAGETSTTWSTPSGAMARIASAASPVRVVHDVVGAGRRREGRLLGRAHRRDDAGARPACELDRRVPDGTGPAGDEHRAAVEGPGAESRGPAVGDGERAMRGHGGHAEGCPDVEARGIRKLHDPIGRQHRELLRRARRSLVGREEDPHPVADLEPGDAGADGVDDARTRPGRERPRGTVSAGLARRPRGPSSRWGSRPRRRPSP